MNCSGETRAGQMKRKNIKPPIHENCAFGYFAFTSKCKSVQTTLNPLKIEIRKTNRKNLERQNQTVEKLVQN